MLSRKAFVTNSLNYLFLWDVWFGGQIVCYNIRLPCLLLIRYLRGHINSVHEQNKPSKSDVSAVAYEKQFSLEHNQNKLMKCDICNVAFQRINYLRAHINSFHDQNKPIKCDVCAVAFLRNTSFESTYKISSITK